MNTYYINYLPGKGKTEEQIRSIKKELTLNKSFKAIYVVPSKELASQIKQRLVKEGIQEEIIKVINSDNITDKTSVKNEIVRVRNNYTSKPSIMIITSKAFLNLENIDLDEDAVYIDEEIHVYENIDFHIDGEITKFIMENYIGAIKCLISDIEFYELKLCNKIDSGFFDQVIMNLDLIKHIKSNNKKVLVIKEHFEEYLLGCRSTISIHVFSDIEHVRNCGKVIFLGFDINHTMMGKVFQNILGYSMNEIISPDTLKYRYNNDIEIIYFSDIDVGNYKLRTRPDISKCITDKIVEMNLSKLCLTDFNFGDYKSKITDNTVGAYSHGLNKSNWTECDNSVILSNYRLQPNEQILFEKLNLNQFELDRMRDVNVKIQILTRNSIRLGNNNKITIVVLDKRSAIGIKNVLKYCNINLIKIDLGLEEQLAYNTTKRIITISSKERRRLEYLRYKKKNNPSKFTKENQEELSKLVLKMNTK